MTQENPKAFKLWISAEIAKKYFLNTSLSAKDLKKILAQLNKLELRARVQLIATELKNILPENFPKALQQLMIIVRQQEMKSFELWPATEFIQMYGLNHIDESLAAMYELTRKFTAEFSIRPFINSYGDRIYEKLEQWKSDHNEHIRRWLSEGTRPRLPWGEKLHAAVKDPKRGLRILDHLKFDPSLYVRKSVSNHLNDISKDHPDLVIKTLQQWQKQLPKNYQKEFDFICNRALRTLIKKGHPGTLQFLGIDLNKSSVKCSDFKINKTKFKMNEELRLELSLKNQTLQPLKFVVDYVIYFKKANGALNPKVFKLKKGFLPPQARINFAKKYSFKPITTRKYHGGEHQIAIQVNGHEIKRLRFDLKV
ncbi:MAG: DNA alkylation repair protein [Pseudobdellovibrionaceae bacterium]